MQILSTIDPPELSWIRQRVHALAQGTEAIIRCALKIRLRCWCHPAVLNLVKAGSMMLMRICGNVWGVKERSGACGWSPLICGGRSQDSNGIRKLAGNPRVQHCRRNKQNNTDRCLQRVHVANVSLFVHSFASFCLSLLWRKAAFISIFKDLKSENCLSVAAIRLNINSTGQA